MQSVSFEFIQGHFFRLKRSHNNRTFSLWFEPSDDLWGQIRRPDDLLTCFGDCWTSFFMLWELFSIGGVILWGTKTFWFWARKSNFAMQILSLIGPWLRPATLGKHLCTHRRDLETSYWSRSIRWGGCEGIGGLRPHVKSLTKSHHTKFGLDRTSLVFPTSQATFEQLLQAVSNVAVDTSLPTGDVRTVDTLLELIRKVCVTADAANAPSPKVTFETWCT